MIHKITGFLICIWRNLDGKCVKDFVKRDLYESAKENDNVAIAFLFGSFSPTNNQNEWLRKTERTNLSIVPMTYIQV